MSFKILINFIIFVKMKLSLINVDTITDAKLPTLNEITMHDHATFITQTDINSEQHRKMIEYDLSLIHI